MLIKSKLRIVLVELSVYERMLPLVSGYLRAYASRDMELAKETEFVFYTASTRKNWKAILQELLAENAAIYGFSCYVWNTRLVKKLAIQIKCHLPEAKIVLGGPQVIGQLKYLDKALDGIFLCNGEGERVFANFLRECTQSQPAFEGVNGISFYAAGEPVTTKEEERIRHLDDIPSPFLSGFFPPDRYTYMTYETNRGCPFHCTFCYWGLGNDRVSKFEEERIFAEIDWISDNSIQGVYFADANFGMLKRDLRIAEYIAQRKQETGYPYMITFNSAKNNPQSVVAIANITQGAGISASQSIAIQSLDDVTLKNVQRSNIKLSAYTLAQQELDKAGFGTFNELIWPLPGETYESFCHGIDKLIGAGAQNFLVHPLVLLQNTEMQRRRAEHGFITRSDTLEGAGEYELVVATKEVDVSEHARGLRFIHALNALFNARCAYFLGRYLWEKRGIRFATLISEFVAYCGLRLDHPYVERMERALEGLRYCENAYWGEHFHYLAHEGKQEFDVFLQEFARCQPWWDDETRTILELDFVNRPHVYSNTPTDLAADFSSLTVLPLNRCYGVRVPQRWRSLVSHCVKHGNGDLESERFQVDHRRGQLPFMPKDTLERNVTYCHAAFLRVVSLHPIWAPM